MDIDNVDQSIPKNVSEIDNRRKICDLDIIYFDFFQVRQFINNSITESKKAFENRYIYKGLQEIIIKRNIYI